MSGEEEAGAPEPGWGPAVEGRARGRRWRRVLVGLLALLVVTAVALPLVLLTQLPRTSVSGTAPTGTPTHVLVIGSDSREGLTREEQNELSTGRADAITGRRTDTIFVMSLDAGDVAMLAFPRDLWVERCDGSIGRINVAYSIGGETCLVETVRALSGIPVQHTMTVTFGGFRDVVDAVGGVEICLDEAIADDDAGIDLPAGCQRLDGADALGYVRVRKIDDDLARIGRQQTFVRALAGEIADPATLLNPVRLVRLMNDMGSAVVVDDDLGPRAAFALARGARGLAGGDMVAHTVPSDPGTTAGGAAVLYASQPAAEELFARFRDGSVFDELAGPDGDATVPPGEVDVLVLNASRIGGAAGRTAELLTGRGYRVTGVGNAEATRDTTLVRHPSGREPAARAVADELAGPVSLESSDAVEQVTILLGRSIGEAP